MISTAWRGSQPLWPSPVPHLDAVAALLKQFHCLTFAHLNSGFLGDLCNRDLRFHDNRQLTRRFLLGQSERRREK